jgi:hypothetical protein
MNHWYRGTVSLIFEHAAAVKELSGYLAYPSSNLTKAFRLTYTLCIVPVLVVTLLKIPIDLYQVLDDPSSN